MNIIRLAIKQPTAMVAIVAMIVLFGFVALRTIPIQLTPDVQQPVLQVTVNWPGAAPADVENEVTSRLEEELGGLEGLTDMESQSQQGRSRVTLVFSVTQDMDKAFVLVSNRLIGISGLPAEADPPSIRTSGSEDNPIARIAIQQLPGNTEEIENYGDFIEDVIMDRLQRIQGVSQVYPWGGTERELRIIIDPEAMARFGLTVPNVLNALRGANASVSAGSVDEGKRRYIVRTESETTTVDRVNQVVLRTQQDRNLGGLSRVTIADIGRVEFSYKESTSQRRYLGNETVAINVVRERGANVIETMREVRAAVAEMNAGVVKRVGLEMTMIYDDTTYIDQAIELVTGNIWLGGALAAMVLMTFLRSIRATLVVSLAIPVSVIGTFVAMSALGLSINVISLAGIAFAVGMVVDAAIVVLENIYRHRQEGKSAPEAAYIGAKQVWGAVFASALTTVVVFIPILLLELTAGQLFRDIAVAISVSVLLSLLVAITVIPALSSRLLANSGSLSGKRLNLPGIDHFARFFVASLNRYTGFVARQKLAAIAVVTVVVIGAGSATYIFLPQLDYLPDGNRNFVIGRVQPPPGYNLDASTRVAEEIEKSVKSLWASETGPASEPGSPPKIEHFFVVSFRDQTFVGATAVEGNRVGELIPLLRQPVFREPGSRGFITQASLFGRGIGGSRSIELDITGENLEELIAYGQRADELIAKILPRKDGTQVRPLPGLELGAPEIRVIPNLTRVSEADMTARDLATTVDAFNDGVRITEITIGGRRMDLMLQGPVSNVTQTQGISNLPVVTPSGDIVPVSSLAEVSMTAGPTEIRHKDRARAITLQIRPDNKIPLETAVEMIRTEVIDKMRAEGLPDDIKLQLSGAADDLSATWQALQYSLLVAIIIVYLVIAILFESFVYPLIIMLSVPLATAGGIGGLALLNIGGYQALDMLTMLGFVILIGIVVNNAILLVDHSLYLFRETGMKAADAICMATRQRVRPIFMSSLTSIFGLLPLVFMPGAGSELYRGLGSVVLGGLTLSAFLTLLVIPPLMSLFMREASTSPALTALPEGAGADD